MRDEEDVDHYYRQFIVLSKPLLNSHRLTTGTRNETFWSGFHKKDRAEMYPRLVAEHPRQPVDVHFDYLDVYKMTRAILRSHVLDIESEDSSDEPRSARSRRSERRYDREARDSRGEDSGYRIYERRRSPSPIDYIPRDSHYRRSDIRYTPPPVIETTVVRFEESIREEEEREVEDLMRRMHGLSVNEEAYLMLYVRCALRSPQVLPKPLLFVQLASTPAPATTFKRHRRHHSLLLSNLGQ